MGKTCTYSFFGVLFLLLLFPDYLLSNNHQVSSIQGVVTDKKTGKPVPDAHVYLSKTTIGTTTDANGEFEFSTNLTGHVKVVFSFIGYQTKTYELNLDSEQNSHFINIELVPISIELNQVEVIGSNKEWQQNYEEFKRHFIGTSRYAKRTVIENPWGINFERDNGGNLRANAPEPIIITNHALGYRIHVDLIEFNWDQNGFTVFYTFYSLFEELEPVNRAQQREWDQIRGTVFKGSSKHFFISLYDDELYSNRFQTVLSNSNARVQIVQPDEVELNQFLIRNPQARLKISTNWKPYKLSRPVDILYGRRSSFKEDRTRSRLVPLNPFGIFLISENGKLYDPKSLRLDGEWSNERIANFLPDDIRFDN